MARIRTVKPNLFKNELLAELPATARLLFIGLFCFADKEGRLEDRPKRIKAEIFPYDSVDCNDLLSRLESAGFITRYEVGEIKVIQVENFTKHQRITGSEAETESEFPSFQGERKQLGNTLGTPSEIQGNNKDDRKGRERKGKDSNVEFLNFPFEEFWDSYDKKVGDKEKLIRKWQSLSDFERQMIMDFIPKYKESQPEKKFRKDPATFFNNRSWQDELIGIKGIYNPSDTSIMHY